MKNSSFNTRINYARFRFNRFARRKLIPAWVFYRGKRFWQIIATIVLIISAQIGYVLFISPQSAKAEWADDSYAYRQIFTFTHNAAVTDPRSITVSISTSTLISAGVMQSDCDDIRFTDNNGKRLLYQLTGTCNNAATTYEVIFPTIISGTNIAYLYYGNSIAVSGSQDVSRFTQLTPSGGDPAITTRTNEEKGQTPLLSWNFNEAYGNTIHDTSSFANNGTLTNALWKTNDSCVFDNCLFFDGTGDYVTKSYSTDSELLPGTGDVSIALWIKHPSTISSTQIILSRADGVNGIGYKLYMNASGNICFGIDDVAGSFPATSSCSPDAYADSQWHHIEAVKLGTTSLTLYIDGKQVAQTGSIASGSLNGTNAPLYIGINADGSSNGFIGFIDEVKIYNYAKTQSQNLADYANRGALLGETSGSIGYTDPKQSITHGLIGYWNMNESSWTNNCSTASVLDSSSNAGNGTACPATTGPTGGAVGKFGKGGSFDGTNDYINISNAQYAFTANTSFSIAGWFKTSTTGTRKGIFGQTDGATNYLGIFVYTDNTLYFENNDSANNYLWTKSTKTVTDGKWHHFIAVRDVENKQMLLYLDGILEHQQIDTRTNTINATTTYIGRDQSNFYMNGTLDDIRLYKRALQTKEILDLSSWGPSPIAYWNMDEDNWTNDCTTLTVLDSSGNNNHGTSCPSSTGPRGGVQGKFGRAGFFDGSNSSINIPDNTNIDAGSENFTISTWVKRTGNATFSDGMYILDKQKNQNTDKGYSLIAATNSACSSIAGDNNKLCFSISDGTNSYRIVTTNDIILADALWHHIEAVIDRSNDLFLYVDGVKQNTAATGTLASVGNIDSLDDLCIGKDTSDVCYNTSPNALLYNFNGFIDDVKLYNYARSDRQILQDYNANHPIVGTPISATVGHWSFDEANGTIAYDKSGQNKNLSLNASTWNVNGKFNSSWIGSGLDWAAAGNDARFNMTAAQNFSISMWFKSTSATNPSNAEYLVGKASVILASYGPGYIIYFNPSGQVVFGIDSDSNWGAIGANAPVADNTLTSTSDLYDTTWHHILVTKTGTSRMDMYIDGKLNSSNTSITAGDLTNTNSLTIGNNNPGPSNGFAGSIDEAKLYRESLTQGDALTEYNQGKIAVFGALSTESDGITSSNSQGRAYCVPGDTSTCTPPVGEWLLDENTATASAYDTSGNGTIGTLTNGPVWSVGKQGSAVSFDSVDDYISLGTAPTISNLNPFTICAWIYPKTEGEGGSSRIFSKSEKALSIETTKQIKLAVNRDTTNATAITANNSVTLNAWNYICSTYDDTNGPQIYINGQHILSYTTYTLGSGALTSDSGSTAYIGNSNDTSNTFNGRIDSLRIYNYVRTPAQIAWEYNRGGPVGLWKFDECNGPTAYDSATTGNNKAGGKNGTWSGATGTNTSFGDCTTNASTSRYTGKNGKFGSSLDFDATDDVVTVTNTSIIDLNEGLFQGFTLSAWIFPDTAGEGSTGRIFDKGTNTYCYTANLVSGKLDLVCRLDLATSATFTVPAAIPTGQWSYVALSWTNDADDEITVWINGTPFTSSALYTGDPNADTNNFFIGNNSAGSATFDGLIDDVRIYPFELTGVQIKTLMNENAAVRFGPLTGTP